MLIGIEAAGFRVSRAGVRKLRYIKDMSTERTFTAFIDNLCPIPTDQKVQPLPPYVYIKHTSKHISPFTSLAISWKKYILRMRGMCV